MPAAETDHAVSREPYTTQRAHCLPLYPPLTPSPPSHPFAAKSRLWGLSTDSFVMYSIAPSVGINLYASGWQNPLPPFRGGGGVAWIRRQRSGSFSFSFFFFFRVQRCDAEGLRFSWRACSALSAIGTISGGAASWDGINYGVALYYLYVMLPKPFFASPCLFRLPIILGRMMFLFRFSVLGSGNFPIQMCNQT